MMDRFFIKKTKLTEPGPSSSVSNNTTTTTSSIGPSGSATEEAKLEEKPSKRYKHKYRESWKRSFKWAENSNDTTMCKVCNKKVVGSVTHLKRHQMSIIHQQNFKLATTTPIKSVLNITSKEKTADILVKEVELKLAMFVTEHNLPFRVIDHLPQLLASACPDSKIAKKLTIKRKKTTQITTAVLGPANKKDLVNDLQKKYFSIIIDETTDISTTKCLALITRYVKEGIIVDRFFDLIELESANALTIFNCIKSALEWSNIPIKNVVGLGADNCAVMMGNINGVRALFQEINPSIVIIGCSCHSFHLCSSYACEKLPKGIEQLSRDIYNYFSNSSKRCLQLKECEIFAMEKPQAILKPSQTRWLSLQSVVNRILEHWASLELFFTRASLEDNVQSASAILNALRNPVYKIYFYFLSYILEIINKLNLEFQSELPKIHVLLSRITSLYKMILKSFLKSSYLNMTDIDKVIVSDPHQYLPLDQIYCGAKVEEMIKTGVLNDNELNNVKVRVLDFYVELAKQIKKRFDFKDKVLQFASKFDPKMVLSGNVSTVSEAKSLFPYLDLNIETLDFEYRLICETEEFKKNTCDNVTAFWSVVNTMKHTLNEPMFPNVMKLVEIILSLPHSSAAAERIFSQLNIIKNKTRNKLLVNTCSALLHSKDMLRVQNKCCFNWTPSSNMTSYTKSLIDQEQVPDIDIFET